MLNPLLEAIGFIVGILFNVYAIVVALRFVMQLVRADYYNPFSQAVVKLTDPLLKPLRRVVPAIGRYDTASLVLMFGVLLAKLIIFKFLPLGAAPAISGMYRLDMVGLPLMLPLALLDMINQFFNVFIFALIIRAILSWFPQAGGNPVQHLATSISEPVLKPLRNRIPPVGGLDISLFLTVIGLYALRWVVVGTLAVAFGIGV
ncbi:MAG: hypothetical protein CSB44_11705 [Gammaproteobacteria bacterium]|nr:MAG: hypothetical protein CSB44_11705 [Gammaproteobacteria bacterium]